MGNPVTSQGVPSNLTQTKIRNNQYSSCMSGLQCELAHRHARFVGVNIMKEIHCHSNLDEDKTYNSKWNVG